MPRIGLSREVVVDAALQVIARHGVQGLSMRLVGEALGVEAMALYRYVPSRAALLDAVVERVVDELYADPEVDLHPTASWQEYLIRLARGVRRMALAHPETFPLVASRPPAAPWIRPPLRSLPWIEALLGSLLACGFTRDEAVEAYRAFSSFLLGHLLLEVSALGADVGPEPEAAASYPDQAAVLADFPLLRELAPELSDYAFEEEFERSLHNLIERIGPGSRA